MKKGDFWTGYAQRRHKIKYAIATKNTKKAKRGMRDEKGRWVVGGGIWVMYNHWKCTAGKPAVEPGEIFEVAR
jgi:hypothetical protein